MSVWYFYYPKRFAFSPLDYETGLGGGEGSLVILTESLVRAGQEVHVFNCCYKPGIYQGVTWHMAWEIEDAPAPDILVSVRFEESIKPDMRAKHRLYWMLDDRSRGAQAFLRLFGNAGGRVIIASNAMREVLSDCQPLKGGSVVDIPLPVQVSSPPLASRSLSCLYCSVPNRGLDILLSIWPSIRSEVPLAHLWVTGGYQLWGYTAEEAEDREKAIRGSTEYLEGVTIFGVLPKRQLSALQASCAFMLYPCRFPEMFCLAAAECTVAGAPIIASTKGALKERVIQGKNGILIEGSIDAYETQQKFIQEAIHLLLDSNRREDMSNASLQIAGAFDPDKVASQWIQLVS